MTLWSRDASLDLNFWRKKYFYKSFLVIPQKREEIFLLNEINTSRVESLKTNASKNDIIRQKPSFKLYISWKTDQVKLTVRNERNNIYNSNTCIPKEVHTIYINEVYHLKYMISIPFMKYNKYTIYNIY